MTHAADAPRACVRCHKVKPARKFPPRGWRFRKRQEAKFRQPSRVCFTCIEDEAYAMQARGFRNRKHRLAETPDGVRLRQCSCCEDWKPIEVFGVSHRAPDGRVISYHYLCPTCAYRKSDAQRKQKYSNPEWKAKRAAEARRLRRDPDKGAKARAANRRWKQKMMADPVERARQNELARMNHRLRKERAEGRHPDRIVGKRIVQRVDEPGRLLPSAPLAALISRMVEHREVVAEAIGEPMFGAVTQVCQDLGTTDRTYRRWRSGEQPTVRLGLAESVLLNADVAAEIVYSADDHREALELLTSPEYVAALTS